MRCRDDNPRMTRARILGALALVGTLALCVPQPALAQGCAMCGTAVQNPHDPLARSMASSIYFMLSMPFLIFFTVAGWLAWHFRRAARRQSTTRGVMPEENPS